MGSAGALLRVGSPAGSGWMDGGHLGRHRLVAQEGGEAQVDNWVSGLVQVNCYHTTDMLGSTICTMCLSIALRISKITKSKLANLAQF